MTLASSGGAEVDAEGRSLLFEVYPGAKLVLDSIGLRNGVGALAGGVSLAVTSFYVTLRSSTAAV